MELNGVKAKTVCIAQFINLAKIISFRLQACLAVVGL